MCFSQYELVENGLWWTQLCRPNSRQKGLESEGRVALTSSKHLTPVSATLLSGSWFQSARSHGIRLPDTSLDSHSALPLHETAEWWSSSKFHSWNADAVELGPTLSTSAAWNCTMVQQQQVPQLKCRCGGACGRNVQCPPGAHVFEHLVSCC